MVTNHDPHTQVIEFAKKTWDLWQPPTPEAVEETLNLDELEGWDGPQVSIIDVFYDRGAWFATYEATT